MARGVRNFLVSALWGKELTALKEEHNKRGAELDALYAKLDADATVTDTDYASTLETMSDNILK